MRRWFILLPVGILAFYPVTASANAGTPLLWATGFHLVFGNAIIGLIECALLGRLFGCRKRKSALILIGANYVSAWAGAWLIEMGVARIDLNIETIRFWFLVFVLATFVVTLLVELPFFWFCLRQEEASWRRALHATPVIHVISYGLLFGWYWMASATSLMSEFEVVRADEMEMAKPYSLYFLSLEGKDVRRQDLSGSARIHRVKALGGEHIGDRVFAQPNEEGTFDLYVLLDSSLPVEDRKVPILESFSNLAPVDRGNGTGWNFGLVPSLATASNWEFESTFWAYGGLRAYHLNDGRKFEVSLELPIAQWRVRNATHLEGDFVVTQLGRDQICLIHPESRRIALLARGKGPIVAKPPPVESLE